MYRSLKQAKEDQYTFLPVVDPDSLQGNFVCINSVLYIRGKGLTSTSRVPQVVSIAEPTKTRTKKQSSKKVAKNKKSKSVEELVSIMTWEMTTKMSQKPPEMNQKQEMRARNMEKNLIVSLMQL